MKLTHEQLRQAYNAARNADSLNAFMCVMDDVLAAAPEHSAEPAEGAQPVAWLTPEGDRAITQGQKQGMLRDGGAGASSVRPYSIPCFADAPPTAIPEGCTPADARKLREANQQMAQEVHELRETLGAINVIRNSIIGLQTLNWSEHVYPLVAALDAAGIEGMDYPEAREFFGAMLDRCNAAEDDAGRYRWLREQNWNESTLFVVAGHHSLVRLGTDCPAGERLDAAIDAARAEGNRSPISGNQKEQRRVS